MTTAVWETVRTGAWAPVLRPSFLPDEKDTRLPGDLGCLRVNLDATLAPIQPKLLLCLGRKVLVAEEDDTTLRGEEGQLILLLIRKRVELNPRDLSLQTLVSIAPMPLPCNSRRCVASSGQPS